MHKDSLRLKIKSKQNEKYFTLFVQMMAVK